MNTQRIKYSIISWDSSFFGYTVARLTPLFLQKNDSLSQTVFKEDKIKLLYATVDPIDDISNKNALSAGGELVDQKILYKTKLTSSNVEGYDQQIISYNEKKATPALLSLALQSGEFSRFHTDRHFIHDEYKKMYTVWLERSLLREIADEVFVFVQDGLEVGFITVKKEKQKCVIGLLAVDKSQRGKAIGTKLMQRVLHYAADNNCTQIEVATQKANTAACRFYEKLGFTIDHIENIYHFWLN